ncbi:thermonuclease family protein [Paenibacillus hamazuiensis]|uniref:thermonuclease family protein n=1 Tax=Paenibacillus hamazuiensis TaxID=2936508 RepID=UPI00200DB830|nr:thermonuclease family protein [Paenibacillus hamazuiensis]
MKKWIFCLALLWLVGCSAGSGAAGDAFVSEILKVYPELKNHKYTTAEVKRVVDGDTFETKNGEKVRLIGVNTPETVKPNSPVEKFGKEASDFTKKQLTGKTVYMFKDTGDTDKYGRLLRYVFLQGETTMFNEVLVREGYANTMSVPPNVMFQDKFVKLEREARSGKKGLWGATP